MVIDKILEQGNLTLKTGKGEFLFSEFSLQEVPLCLIKPLTFMNLSGIAISEAKKYFGVDNNNMLVVLDDINISFGSIRLRKSGSDGGHKGLASVIYHLSTEDFPRLRLGIGSPKSDLPLSEYVLLNFNKEEKEHLQDITENSVACVKIWATDGIETAMNQTNKKNL